MCQSACEAFGLVISPHGVQPQCILFDAIVSESTGFSKGLKPVIWELRPCIFDKVKYLTPNHSKTSIFIGDSSKEEQCFNN